MNRAAPLVLGIETSCDETGVGIVRGTELLANVIASSMDEHSRYGGVVPEVAARAHLEALGPTISAALAEAVRRGAAHVFLEVRADNPVAEALYLSEGFVELARRPRYYQPDDVDAVVMRLDLRAWTTRPASGSSATDAGACT